MSWWSHCYLFSRNCTGILSLYTTVYASFSQGSHIDSWKVRLRNSPATWINCHLLGVNGGLKNGEGPIVSCDWYAEYYSNTIRTLNGSDQNLLHLYPLICGELSSPCCTRTAPVKETNRNSLVMRPQAHPCMAHGGPKHPYLYLEWSQLCLVFSPNHVFKGTPGLSLSKHFACRVAERVWNIMLSSPVLWSNNQWWTHSQ